MTRALVLGGGGVAGIAWETGLLAGLAKAGVDVSVADFVLGTSAGSVVATQVATGVPLDEQLARQVDPARQVRELVPVDTARRGALDGLQAGSGGDPAESRREQGRIALAAETVPESTRRAVISERLPVHEWPDRSLAVVAVEALTGEPVLFDRLSGVGLVDAVAASCAVPAVWPPVTIGDRRYVDGGVRSANNIDLALGHDRILVVAVFVDPDTAVQAAFLTERGAEVALITPDERATEVIMSDPLAPENRIPAALAGLAQAESALEAATRWLG